MDNYKFIKQIEDDIVKDTELIENIVGLDGWRSLTDWDQQILTARVHKIIVEYEYLRKLYFA